MVRGSWFDWHWPPKDAKEAPAYDLLLPSYKSDIPLTEMVESVSTSRFEKGPLMMTCFALISEALFRLKLAPFIKSSYIVHVGFFGEHSRIVLSSIIL